MAGPELEWTGSKILHLLLSRWIEPIRAVQRQHLKESLNKNARQNPQKRNGLKGQAEWKSSDISLWYKPGIIEQKGLKKKRMRVTI